MRSLLAGLFALVSLLHVARGEGPPRRPNILYIMADDHAAHAISAYGSTINTTPNLDRIARVVHAPLQGDPPWYPPDELPNEIDLLIVDGPPAFEPGHGAARAAALPRLDDRLVHDASVILDDINRPGEQQVIATWETSTSWRFELNLAAGVAIGQRRTEPPSP